MKEKRLKHLTYEQLLKYPTSVLYRMRNCLLYYDSLDDETQCDIMDILIERYYEHYYL